MHLDAALERAALELAGGDDSNISVDTSPAPAASAHTGPAVDLVTIARARDDLDNRFRDLAQTFENATRHWKQLDEQLSVARGEVARLRDVGQAHDRLTTLYSAEKANVERLERDLAETRTRETAANERADKFEEVCEQIKERAVEIHNSLQQARTAEQAAQAEIDKLRSELVEVRRNLQDETASRVSAEDRASKLEAVEAEARDRVAKLVQDNKAMAAQVPQLLVERDKWQKQFSASERENARMQSERRVVAERVDELENEIRTLRADLAGLGTRAAPVSAAAQQPTLPSTREPVRASVVTPQAHEPAPAAIANASSTNSDAEFEDDFDLVSSLDRAFSLDEPSETPPRSKH